MGFILLVSASSAARMRGLDAVWDRTLGLEEGGGRGLVCTCSQAATGAITDNLEESHVKEKKNHNKDLFSLPEFTSPNYGSPNQRKSGCPF